MTNIARTIHTYEIVGYDAYFVDVLPDLTEILSELTDENSYFIIAINEAVCNAAKYSVYGYEEAKIKIELIITNEDVTATVISKTKPFNALEYRNKLLKLKENAVVGIYWNFRKKSRLLDDAYGCGLSLYRHKQR